MGLLERLRAESNVCKFEGLEEDVTFRVAPESHTVAYAIAVSAAERDALADLVAADEAATDREDSLAAALSAALDDEHVDADAVVDRIRRPRRVAGAVAERWAELLDDDPDVVYLPIGMAADLAAFVATCRERADAEDDSFSPPDSFEEVATLLVRIKEATERPDNRIVVHRDRVPTVHPVQRNSDSPSSEESS